MSGFDLVFALFGLVLGLAITEVLGGFSRVMKMRGTVHVGWLVPLLGLLVLIYFYVQPSDPAGEKYDPPGPAPLPPEPGEPPAAG